MSNEVMKKDTGSVALFGNDLQKGFINKRYRGPDNHAQSE